MSISPQDQQFADALAAAADGAEAADGLPALFGGANYRMLADMPVRLSVEVGSASLRLKDVLALAEGSLVELDRQADAPIDIKVNGALVAHGEIVATGGRFGVRLIDVVGDDALTAGLERRL
ncbi:MAG: hypothetical protein RLZZ58_974 [Pseudomonadota bacterium]